VSGESEAKIRQFFKEAKRLAPCLVFIDEIDAITQKRETAQREMERRIVAQFLTSIDGNWLYISYYYYLMLTYYLFIYNYY
jgi:ribosome biogenesis ATPase